MLVPYTLFFVIAVKCHRVHCIVLKT